MQPVDELDEDDAHVLRHRQQHLADVLGLLLLVAAGAVLGQLRDSVDETADLRSKPLLDVFDAVVGVLGDVVQQRGNDRVLIEAEVGEDLRHGQWMADVGLAADALLISVCLDRELPGVADRLRVRLRMVAEQLLLDLPLATIQSAPAQRRIGLRAGFIGARSCTGSSARHARPRSANRFDGHPKVSVP